MAFLEHELTAEIFARDGVMFGSRARTLMDPVVSTAGHGGFGMSWERQAYLFEIWLEQTTESLIESCYGRACIDLFAAEARLTFYLEHATSEQTRKWTIARDEAFDDVANAREAV